MDRSNRGIDRDLARVNRSITNTLNTPVTDLKYVRGAYLIKLALGTPPYEFLATADTGSEKTWIQCHPCRLCYAQNYPIFKPTQSSTFKLVTCNNSQVDCPAFEITTCENNICTHFSGYADGAISLGVLSTDMMTIESTTGQPFKVDHYMFGCGMYNKGNFKPESAGIVGLGRGLGSLITQLDEYINGKFSYCLSRDLHEGKLNFGENAVVQGSGVITTPLTKRDGKDSLFYWATLEGLTIGTDRVNYNTNPGNILIDSGTHLTEFPKNIYDKIKNSLLRQATAPRVEHETHRLEVCFEDVNGSFQFIPITAHFAGGADVVLQTFNMFVKKAPDVICLAVAQDPDALWGIYAQTNFLVGFDIAAETVSFKPNQC